MTEQARITRATLPFREPVARASTLSSTEGDKKISTLEAEQLQHFNRSKGPHATTFSHFYEKTFLLLEN